MGICRFISFFLFVSLAIANTANGQVNFAISEGVVLGETADGEEIIGRTLKFSDKVYRLYIDSLRQSLIVHLRPTKRNGKYYKPKGQVVCLDMNANRVKWRRDINYSTSIVDHMNHMLIERKAYKSININLDDGNENWETKATLIFVAGHKDVAIGYTKIMNEKKSTLVGIDVNTGKTLWEEKVSPKYGWRDIVPLSDSTLLISSSGLHVIDYRKGKLWEYQDKSGKENFNFWTTVNVLYNMNSNVWLEEDALYYSTDVGVVKYTEKGERLWGTTLPYDKAGTSYLVEYDAIHLMLLNTGYVNSTNMYYKEYGEPQIILLNKQTGEIIKHIEIPEKQLKFVRDYHLRNDEIVLTNNRQISIINLDTGEVRAHRTYGSNGMKVLGIVDDGALLKSPLNGEFEPMNVGAIEEEGLYIHADDDRLVRLDSDLKPTGSYSIDQDVYVIKGITTNEDVIYSNGHSSYILDEEGQIKAIIEDAQNWIYRDGYYYVISDDKIHIIAESDL